MENDPQDVDRQPESVTERVRRLQRILDEKRERPLEEPFESFSNFNNWDSFTNWGNR